MKKIKISLFLIITFTFYDKKVQLRIQAEVDTLTWYFQFFKPNLEAGKHYFLSRKSLTRFVNNSLISGASYSYDCSECYFDDYYCM